MDESQELDFKVGEWWVRPLRDELERGETKVRLEARSMQVLACLARQASGLVSKQRIIEEVWGEAYVGEEVISHAIWELRKAFEDNARNPSYIETIPRKGYRLLAEVVRPVGEPTPAQGARVGHYRIEEEIGSGAMGVVYKAVDLRLKRTVAVKFLAPELTRDATARKRFQREARIAASVDHPNLATVHEIGETAGGRQYIVTTYYSGGSLKERLEGGSIELDEVVDVGAQVAAGLAAAHQRDIVHRDVKPANILLTEAGTAKIVDFGLAKLLGDSGLTKDGDSLGTPAYKSPEQSRGRAVDHRSDIWSLGVVLYEMITGKKPFHGEYDQAIVNSILTTDPEFAEGLGPPSRAQELRRVVLKALAKSPEDRYQSATELAAELQRCRDTAASPAITPRNWLARLRTRWWAAALAAVLTVTASYLMSHGAGSDTPAGSTREVTRLLGQGVHYELRGDDVESLEAAERVYRRALQLAPDDPRVQAHLAALLIRYQRQIQKPGVVDEIRRLVNDALAAEPELGVAWLARAKLSLLEGDQEAAQAAAQRAVELNPDDDRGYTTLGEAIYSLGRVDEGLGWIRRGMEHGLGHVRARLVLADKLWEAGDENASAVEYENVLDYAPDHPTARNNLGVLYLRMNRNLEALGILRQLFLEKRDFRVANNLGAALFNLDRWQEALEAFHEAYQLDPSSPSAPMGLGDTHLMLGNLEDMHHWFEVALDNVDQILEDGAAPVERIGQRAVCLAKLQRFDEAFQEIERALDKRPNLGPLLFNAAQVRALAGDRKGLHDYARKALEAGYSPEDFWQAPSFQAFLDDPELRDILEGTSADPPSEPRAPTLPSDG